MKKILSIVAICLMLFSCKAQTNEKIVGENKNGVYEVTLTTAELKTLFYNSVNEKGLVAHLTSFVIKKDVVEGSTTEYYYLLGASDDNSIKMATTLKLAGHNLFAAEMSLQASNTFSSSCTCSGTCTKGCDPKLYIDKDRESAWRCTSCTQKGKTCNKSVTAN